jgi:hypothetical protein
MRAQELLKFPKSRIADQPVGLLAQRAVGLLALMVGLSLLWLGLFVASKGVALPAGINGTVAAVSVAALALSALFLSWGWRMTLNKPNKYTSISSPLTWYFLASAFMFATAAVAVQMAVNSERLDLQVLLGGAFFSVLAASAGRLAALNTAPR